MKLIVASLLLVVLQLLKSPTTASDADGESTVAPRIIGGDRVEDVNKYPTFAMVRSRRREDGELKTSFCGGVLVSPTAVLVSVAGVGSIDVCTAIMCSRKRIIDCGSLHY
jgi:secreted trypsin-like serine protease